MPPLRSFSTFVGFGARLLAALPRGFVFVFVFGTAAHFGFGFDDILAGGLQLAADALRHGAFGNGDDAEAFAAAAARPDGLGDRLDIKGNFRDQDDIRAASQTRAQRQPAGVVAHDLADDDAVVAVGGGMQAVDGFAGDIQRRIKAKCDIGAR